MCTLQQQSNNIDPLHRFVQTKKAVIDNLTIRNTNKHFLSIPLRSICCRVHIRLTDFFKLLNHSTLQKQTIQVENFRLLHVICWKANHLCLFLHYLIGTGGLTHTTHALEYTTWLHCWQPINVPFWWNINISNWFECINSPFISTWTLEWLACNGVRQLECKMTISLLKVSTLVVS